MDNVTEADKIGGLRMVSMYDNMPLKIAAFDELPDDIDAVITYNDGVHFQLILRRQGKKVIGHRGPDWPAYSIELESGGLIEIPGKAPLAVYESDDAYKQRSKSGSFRQKQGRAVRAFMRPQGKKVA